MLNDELLAYWQKMGMPSRIADGDVCIEKWPDEWEVYKLLPCSAAEDFLFAINKYNAKSDDGYLWHGKYKGFKYLWVSIGDFKISPIEE